MTCQEDLLQQAQQVAAKGSGNRVFTYFNLVKALPWYTAVRELLEDEAYSGFFLRYGLGTPPASPACDPVTGDCSSLFHDQLQTPAVPGSPPPFGAPQPCDAPSALLLTPACAPFSSPRRRVRFVLRLRQGRAVRRVPLGPS